MNFALVVAIATLAIFLVHLGALAYFLQRYKIVRRGREEPKKERGLPRSMGLVDFGNEKEGV